MTCDPRVPRLLAISDHLALGRRSLDDWLGALAAAGVDAVQLRAKAADDRELFELAAAARRSAPAAMRVLVNGRVDLAVAAGCDGVHLPADGIPVAALRRRFGADVLIGRSTHRPEEIAAARRDGADYVTFSPIFTTPSKARYGAPVGLDGLAGVTGRGLPVLALGGIDPDRVATVARAGAAGVAGIRVFHDDDTLTRLATTAAAAWPAP